LFTANERYVERISLKPLGYGGVVFLWGFHQITGFVGGI